MLLLVLLLVALAAPAAPAQAQPSAPRWIAAKPLIVYANPVYSNLRVPAPERPVLQNGVHTSAIIVDFVPGGTDGCLDFPAEARTAYQYAADIWGGLLPVTVPVHISACWAPMGEGYLGAASTNFTDGFANQPYPNTWYPVSLANQLAGSDLNGAEQEIVQYFNSQFDAWSFGLSGSPSYYEWDFVSVVFHEIGHGLGFTGMIEVAGGRGYNNSLSIFDRFTCDSAGTPLTSYPNNSPELAAVLTSAAFFNGPQARAANGGNRVPLFTPSSWMRGSSYSHLAESFNGGPNALMTYSLQNGEAIHSPGPVTMGLLADVGWPFQSTPAAPANLALSAVSETQINLSWQDKSSNETGFEVERSTDGTNWSKIATAAANATTYANSGLTKSTRYHYRVRAVNGIYPSEYSNTAAIYTLGPPAAPLNLKASPAGLDKIIVRWTDNSPNETGFRIERSGDGGKTWALLMETGPNATSYTNTGLVMAKTYHYRVSAKASAYLSAFAGPVSATTWSVERRLNLAFLAR